MKTAAVLLLYVTGAALFVLVPGAAGPALGALVCASAVVLSYGLKA